MKFKIFRNKQISEAMLWMILENTEFDSDVIIKESIFNKVK